MPGREWRKIHRGIIDSEKIARVSDSAFRLFTLLIVAQDDDGKYPWTPTKLRALTIAAQWDDKFINDMGRDLAAADLITCDDLGFVHIVGGVEKNGLPNRAVSKRPFLFDFVSEPTPHQPQDVDPPTPYQHPGVDATNTQVLAREEKSREEKSREEREGDSLNANPPHTLTTEDEGKIIAATASSWSEAIDVLHEIKAKTPLRTVAADQRLIVWLDQRATLKPALIPALAYRVALALQGKWSNKRMDVRATYQNWILMELERDEKKGSSNGTNTGGQEREPWRTDLATAFTAFAYDET